jgi:hypothetical protein
MSDYQDWDRWILDTICPDLGLDSKIESIESKIESIWGQIYSTPIVLNNPKSVSILT